MILGSIGEWILGNTFPFVVFGTYGKFSLTQTPFTFLPLTPPIPFSSTLQESNQVSQSRD